MGKLNAFCLLPVMKFDRLFGTVSWAMRQELETHCKGSRSASATQWRRSERRNLTPNGEKEGRNGDRNRVAQMGLSRSCTMEKALTGEVLEALRMRMNRGRTEWSTCVVLQLQFPSLTHEIFTEGAMAVFGGQMEAFGLVDFPGR